MRRALSRRHVRHLIIKEYRNDIKTSIISEKACIKRNNKILRKIQILERKGYSGFSIDRIIAEDLKKYIKKAKDTYAKGEELYGKAEQGLEYAQSAVDMAKQISDATGFKPQDLGIDIDLDEIDLDPEALIGKLLEKLGLEEAKMWLGGKLTEMLGVPEGSAIEKIIEIVMEKFTVEDIIDVATGKADCGELTERFVVAFANGLLALGLEAIVEKVQNEFPIASSMFGDVQTLAADYLGIDLSGETSSPLVDSLYNVIGEKIESLLCKRGIEKRDVKLASEKDKEAAIKDEESVIKEILLLSNVKAINEIKQNNKRYRILS